MKKEDISFDRPLFRCEPTRKLEVFSTDIMSLESGLLKLLKEVAA